MPPKTPKKPKLDPEDAPYSLKHPTGSGRRKKRSGALVGGDAQTSPIGRSTPIVSTTCAWNGPHTAPLTGRRVTGTSSRGVVKVVERGQLATKTKIIKDYHGFLTLKYSKTAFERLHLSKGVDLPQSHLLAPATTNVNENASQAEETGGGDSVDVPVDFTRRLSDSRDSAIDVSTPRVNLGPLSTPKNIMAPVGGPDMVSDALKDVIQDLFDIQSKVHGYQHDTQGPLVEKMVDLTGSLSRVNALTNPNHPNSVAHTLPSVPPELVDYVDSGRNPEIYTREIVELVQRGNAVVNGKMEAFRGFSEVFARKLRKMDGEGTVERKSAAAPEGPRIDMEREVDRIMQNAGLQGDWGVKEERGSNGVTVKKEEDEERKGL